MEEQDPTVPSLFMIPLVQFLVGLLLFAALLHGQRDLIVLTLLVLGLFSGVKLWTRISLPGIKCHSSVDREKVFPDEKIILRTTAENNKFLPVWLQVKVPVDGSLDPSSGEGIRTNGSALLWHQRTYFQWELTAQRRGVHQIGPPRLLAGDLFAFSSREKREEQFHQIVVYPRLAPLKPFSLARTDFFGVPGAKSPVQDPIYILGTRDYQHGTPAKHIHWKASARHNRLQEKLFEPTAQEKVLLVVDVDPFAKREAVEPFERTLETVASLAVKLDRQNCAAGLMTNGDIVGGGQPIVPVAGNPQRLSAILELLARLQMKSKGKILDLLCGGLELPSSVSCVYFSYEEDETFGVVAQYLGHRRRPVTFFVCEPRLDSGGKSFKGLHQICSLDDLCAKEAKRNEQGEKDSLILG